MNAYHQRIINRLGLPALVLLAVVILFTYQHHESVQEQIATATSVHLTAIAPTPTLTPSLTPSLTPTITPTPTPTPSHTPTPTPTPTLSPTPTLTPTITPSPTTVPCQASVLVNATIYAQPSEGRLSDSISLDRGAGVALYARLKDEPWWQASRKSSIAPEGWIKVDVVDAAADCQRLPQVGLEAIVGPEVESDVVIVADTFSTFDHEWVSEEGTPALMVVGEQDTKLKMPSGTPSRVRLADVQLVGNFELRTSFERASNTLQNSYVGMRFVSQETNDAWIELRLHRNRCAFSYHVFVDGQEQRSTSPHPLGSDAGCSTDDVTYLFLAVRPDEKQGAVTLRWAYNDESPQEFPIPDQQRLFSKVAIELISYRTITEFDYILIMYSSE